MKTSNILIAALFFFVISIKPTFAYLDPGTGSFILQVLAAGFLGGLFAVKTFWNNITTFFSNLVSKTKVKSKQPAASSKRSDGKNK